MNVDPRTASGPREAPHLGAILAPGILIGAGMGGFVDGILLHQLLQWHNMMSSVRPPTDLVAMKYNMIWDGAFHALAWSVTAIGIFRLWAARRRPEMVLSTRAFAGALAIGWGLFNLVEGVIDHHLLGLHHVRPGRAELAWDIAFFAPGVVLLAAGLGLVRAARAGAGAGGQKGLVP